MVGTAKLLNRRAHIGIEAVDRVQEPDAGDLLEVLDRLSGVPVAMGEAARERQVLRRTACSRPQPRERQW